MDLPRPAGPVAARLALAFVLMGVLALAGIEITRHSGRIASVWLANAAVLAIALRTVPREWPALIGASFVANILANLYAGDSLLHGTGLAICNSVEIATACALLRHVAPVGRIEDPGTFFRIARAALAAPLVSAIAALMVLQPPPADALRLIQQWYVADALGLLIVTPVTLAWSGERPRLADARAMFEPLALILLSAACTALVFESAGPRIFLLAPLLLVAGFRLGPAAATGVALASAVTAAALTFTGTGPIAAASLSPEGRMLLLQAYVAVAILLTLPVSALTRQRDVLNESLKQSESRHRLLAENATDIIIRIGIDRRLRFVSRASARVLGYDPEALLGFAAHHAIHPDDLAEVGAVFDRVVAGVPGLSSRYRQRRADGEYRWMEASYNLVDSDAPGEREVVAVVRDVTARVADEQRLVAALNEARTAAEAKSGFLATMSHEIRTPMTGVLGMIELLRGDPTEAERVRYLVTLKQSADLLMTVLDDVLDFSKMEYGSLELRTVDFDFEELAQSTLDLFFNAASSKGLLITMAVDPGVSALIHADPVRLQQVMSNLINNAIKFTDEGSIRIRIKATPAGEGVQRWRVEVRDTGVGIEEAYLSSLFDPFSQADCGNGRRYGGTGLGLAISRKLIEAMGGTMGVESVAGEGSSFWFELDLPAAKASLLAKPPASARLPGSHALDVLVAEDNPVNQLLISALLRRQGHRPTCVANGRDAVAAATARPYDCILMDMQMPVMDGIGATAAIRSSGGPCADAPIIALTADASPERRRFYDNAGLTDFMTKPIDDEALANRLAQIVPGEGGGAAAALDGCQIDRLRAALGPRRLAGLVELFEAELDSRPARIESAAQAGDWENCRKEAHALKGAALNLGAVAVADAAKAFEEVDGRTGVAGFGALFDALVGAITTVRPALAAFTTSRRAAGG